MPEPAETLDERTIPFPGHEEIALEIPAEEPTDAEIALFLKLIEDMIRREMEA